MGSLRRRIQHSLGGGGEGCSASCEREGRSAKVSPKAKEGVLEAKCRSMERLGTSVVEAKGTVCTKPQRDMTQ